MITNMTLSARRTQMLAELDDNPRSAEFEYRRDVTDDIEKILRDADVFKPTGDSFLDRYEESALLRRLAEDIAAYIVR